MKGFFRQQPELFSQAMRVSQRVALWEEHIWHTTVAPEGELYLLGRATKLSWTDLVFRADKELVRSRKLGNGRNRTLGFSKNLKRGFFDARTVAYLALQIAYHVGFTKVFLVGVDLNQSVSRFYEGSDTLASPCLLDQHFYTRILPSLEILSKYVVDADFQVYNLSSSSRIPGELIPRVTLDEIDKMINTDDDIIAGNVAQLAGYKVPGHICRVRCGGYPKDICPLPPRRLSSQKIRVLGLLPMPYPCRMSFCQSLFTIRTTPRMSP